ncbi:hypothetical protein [Rhizobacter sp. Root1221]|uniref:hypothetical protein n=1 Tax=Rhizobacter sp. Root1221 TaxID=1736433 RepID=UPI0006FABA6A|nr:hypothetical protein [Rhizobacter sp. Root1221]KQV85450.1 hypothetical protein ASC87_07100 [Rhizobacter sp. Root1221]
MRPRGEIRDALAQAFIRLLSDRGLLVEGVAVDGVSVRESAAAAQVGFDAARRTVENMVRAGQLVRISSVKRAGSQHWEGLYAPAEFVPGHACGVAALANALQSIAAPVAA